MAMHVPIAPGFAQMMKEGAQVINGSEIIKYRINIMMHMVQIDQRAT